MTHTKLLTEALFVIAAGRGITTVELNFRASVGVLDIASMIPDKST